MVKFKVSKKDGALIEAIIARAWDQEWARSLYKGDKLHLHMDVTAAHANGNPLRLKDLLEADDFNFIHDIGGIARHLDRETGKLLDCFSPRFSQPEADEVAA